jgi:cytochrome P450
MSSYLQAKIDEHRGHPGEDAISFLLNGDIDGEPLSDVQILIYISQLLIAGIDTTWSAIGSSLHHLALHPEDRRHLVAALDEGDETRWIGATEELLRAFAPVALGRYVTREVEMCGQLLQPGDMVLLNYPSANRDPRVFDHPEEVHFDRAGNRHVTFGAGIHRCLGRHLARTELRVALQAFLGRIPEFHLAEDVEVHYSVGITRGPHSLPLVIDRHSERTTRN